MKVKELINNLKCCNPEADVMYFFDDGALRSVDYIASSDKNRNVFLWDQYEFTVTDEFLKDDEIDLIAKGEQ